MKPARSGKPATADNRPPDKLTGEKSTGSALQSAVAHAGETGGAGRGTAIAALAAETHLKEYEKKLSGCHTRQRSNQHRVKPSVANQASNSIRRARIIRRQRHSNPWWSPMRFAGKRPVPNGIERADQPGARQPMRRPVTGAETGVEHQPGHIAIAFRIGIARLNSNLP